MIKNKTQIKHWSIIIITLTLLVGIFAVWRIFATPQDDLKRIKNKNRLIRVLSPQPYETLSSPIIITGEARGNWFFEATFPIKLINEKGETLIQHYAEAQGEWMTENFVPFKAQLNFKIDKSQKAFLVLVKSNPSALPKNDDEIRIPVILKETKNKEHAIKLYYYSPELDKDASGNILCSKQGLISVKRQIPLTQTPIQDAIKLLIQGKLTQQEIAQGITTEYPLENFSLKGASLKDGVLTLEFNDPQNKSVGGACRTGILWFQIEATAKQFPEVREVKFLPEYLFQP